MSLFRITAILILALCAAHFVTAQVKSTKAVPGGVITGSVTIKGKPAIGITVIVWPNRGSYAYEGTYKAKTDQAGKYRFTDVPQGSYQVAPSAPSFVPASNSTRNEAVVLGENETVEGIDFDLVRGGVITGKVVDANGRPLVEQPVNLVSAERGPRQPMVIQNRDTMTDDRGIYRMFGLMAGTYKVYVGESDDNFVSNILGKTTYKQTFHPGVTEESEAKVVEVKEGSEVTNVDIAVGAPTQTYSVAGVVVDGATGKPLPNLRFGLQFIADAQHTSFLGTNTSSNSRGEFRIENLAPGKYGIFLTPQPGSEVRSETLAVDIVDQDVEGIVIKTSRGASVSGRVVLENATDAGWEKLTQLELQGFVRSGTAGGFVQRSPIAPDGSFAITGLQEGTLNISLGAADRKLLQGFSVMRIERDQVPQPRELEIKAGEQITNLQVVVSHGTATVRGTIKPVSGNLPPGARMFLRITKSGERTGLQPPLVDARGHFMVEGLAPGTYSFLVTIAGPEITRPFTTRHEVIVPDGGITEITITIDLDAKPRL